MDALSSKIYAVIVGIDTYRSRDLPRLYHAVSDARKLAQLLKQDLQVPGSNVKELYNDAATKDAILDAIVNLPNARTDSDNGGFEPGHAILFFFFGLAGRANENVGMICPVDINTESQTGISDSTLTRLFNQISRSYGDNIVGGLCCS